MPLGPGKYDEDVAALKTRYHADCVAIIVLGGDKGAGFSMQSDLDTILTLPEMLEDMAVQLRADRAAIISRAH